ncbi:MAG: alpha/beta hydrolase [Deltaproteobacteria bacterium]|nr:alpha/beta hydrolase [Deltaproteobacteria bacterium]
MMMKDPQIIKSEIQKLGEISVEVCWIQTEDAAEIAVSHIKPRITEKNSLPVILLHGTYSKRNFWISPKGIGLGAYLAEQGFDVWIPELRGHGLSPKGERFSSITAEEQIRFDIPAINRFVTGQTKSSVSWICHSFAGVYTLASLSCGWLDQNSVSRLITFGSQISRGESFLKIPPIAWICILILKILGNFPAPKFGMGPEIESAGSMIEVIRWKGFRGKWTNSEGFCYWDGMDRIKIPILSFAAAADTNDPPEGCRILFDSIGSEQKTFTLLGKKNGFLKDYDHIGMVVSKESQTEIWPMVTNWLTSEIN